MLVHCVKVPGHRRCVCMVWIMLGVVDVQWYALTIHSPWKVSVYDAYTPVRTVKVIDWVKLVLQRVFCQKRVVCQSSKVKRKINEFAWQCLSGINGYYLLDFVPYQRQDRKSVV